MRHRILVPMALAVVISCASGAIVGYLYGVRNTPSIPQFAEQPLTNGNDSPEMRQRKESALLGSGTDAFKLITYYVPCAGREAEKMEPVNVTENSECVKQVRFWSQIAAENGSEGGMEMTLDDLLHGNSCYSAYRASYWLSKITATKDSSIDASRDQEINRAKQNCRW